MALYPLRSQHRPADTRPNYSIERAFGACKTGVVISLAHWTDQGVEILTQAAVSYKANAVLSPATLRRVMRGDVPPAADRALRALADGGLIDCADTRAAAIDALHEHLVAQHQLEHVYKSVVARKRFLARHHLQRSSILTEFTIGSSCADIIIVNGKATGYEIKTAYDSAAKLKKQLEDYFKVLRYVYVVVHEADETHYQAQLRDSNAGLLVLTKRGSLSERRSATEHIKNLDNETMMKSLRKPEYSSIIRDIFGDVPSGRAVDYFQDCLALVRQVHPVEFQLLFENALRRRVHQSPVQFSLMPCNALQHVCLQLNPTGNEYQRILTWLKGRIE